MTKRLPKPVYQLDGSPLAGLNCECAVHATMADAQSDGRVIRTAGQIRALTGDTSGGTTNEENADALAKLGLLVQTMYVDWQGVLNLLNAGHMLAVTAAYARVASTRWSGQTAGFTGNHEFGLIGVIGSTFRWTHDPLADGRFSGASAKIVAKGPFSDFPLSLMHSAMLDATNDRDAFDVTVSRVLSDVAAPPGNDAVRYAYGGKPLSRGIYHAVPLVAKAYVRPNITGTVVARLRRGQAFHVRQTTAKGEMYLGSTTWYGDATGAVWLHHSELTPA